MPKMLQMVCTSPISQFVVKEAGMYAWRNIRVQGDSDSAWIFGICKEGNKIDGQYEGCGPISWKTVEVD